MNSGRILVSGSSFYCGNSTSSPCQLALKSDIPNVTQYVHPSTKQCNYSYTHPSAIQCSAATEINNLKSSVSSGKTQVANAITGKGVSASGNDTFATLASKIGQITTITQTQQNILNFSKTYRPTDSSYTMTTISVPTMYLCNTNYSGGRYLASTNITKYTPSNYSTGGLKSFSLGWDWDISGYSSAGVWIEFEYYYSDSNLSYRVINPSSSSNQGCKGCTATIKNVSRVSSNSVQITFSVTPTDDPREDWLEYYWNAGSDRSAKDVIIQISGSHRIEMTGNLNV